MEMWSSLQVFKQKLWEVDKYLIHSGSILMFRVDQENINSCRTMCFFFQIAQQQNFHSHPTTTC